MEYSDIRAELVNAILDLEATMAKYAIFTLDDEMVERWEKARNEYLSLLTWLRENR